MFESDRGPRAGLELACGLGHEFVTTIQLMLVLPTRGLPYLAKSGGSIISC